MISAKNNISIALITSVFCFLICINEKLYAQHISPQKTEAGIKEESDFIQHLLENRFYDESIIYLHQLKKKPFAISAVDSINYFLGVSHYYKKQLDSSNKYLFLMQLRNFEVFEKSKILQGFNFLYLRNYRAAQDSLSGFLFEDAVLKTFAKVEIAAAQLLNKDTFAFRNTSANFSANHHYAVARAEKALMMHYTSMKEIKSKSPALAGISSALVPGLGKVYAGKTGQGISSFLICTVLGAQAVEAYAKGSWRSPYFFIYSGLFSIFYTGNVYGSVVSARNYNNEKYEAIRSQMLIDLHIPLRTVLDL